VRLLPAYRCVYMVQLGDCARTAFWSDWCLDDVPLDATVPELFSHTTLRSATVRQVICGGLAGVLAPRLSPVASRQREAWPPGSPPSSWAWVRTNVSSRSAVVPRAGSMSRPSTICARTAAFDPAASTSSGEAASSKVSFFAWILLQGRTHANLLKKGIVDQARSGCAICPAALETPMHIFFECPFAVSFWRALGCPTGSPECIADAASCGLPATVHPRSAAMLRLLFLWHLWKHRNGVMFNHDTASLPRIRKDCRDAASLWRARLPLEHRIDVDCWLRLLHPNSL
jgi:hypothetical protein